MCMCKQNDKYLVCPWVNHYTRITTNLITIEITNGAKHFSDWLTRPKDIIMTVKEKLNILTRKNIWSLDYDWHLCVGWTDTRHWLVTLFLCDFNLIVLMWHYDYCASFKGPIISCIIRAIELFWLLWYDDYCNNFYDMIISYNDMMIIVLVLRDQSFLIS